MLPMQAESSVDVNPKGIGWLLAACFLIGDLAGAGMMALPVALVQGGVYFGTSVSFICALCACYGGVLLGKNLMILRRRWPEYRAHNGKPFTEMAKRSMGRGGETVLKIMFYCSSMGTNIVYILLAASNISTFVNGNFGLHVHKCFTIVVVGFILWPMVMPNRPMDFGWVAIAATASTCVAVGVIMVGTGHDLPACSAHADYSAPTSMESMALTFGTIMFAYGGHVAFPTIQIDMKRPGEFSKSVWLTFAVLCFGMFTPVSLFGYYVYGNSMLETIITSIQVNWMQQLVSFMMTIHVLTSYIILFSPLCQGAEAALKTPAAFSMKRFLIRSALMWFTVFVALSVPRFGVILDLVGGSFSTSIAVIWPGILYLLLSAALNKSNVKGAAEKEEKPSVRDVFQHNSTLDLIRVFSMMSVGVVGGACATSTAFVKLFGAEMEMPCYVQLFTQLSAQPTGGAVACCGVGKNVSVWESVDVSQYCGRY